MCVLQNVVLAKSRAGAGVLCCFHLQLWERGSSLFAPSFSSFCCVAFYSTTTTGAWPCWEKGYVLVSYFLPFSTQYISASKRLLVMHTEKGESKKLAVKEYEFYNRGLALSDLSWLLIGWFLQFLASDWLGPEGCSLLLLFTTEAQGRCEERGHVVGPSWLKPKLRSSLFSQGRLVCRSGGATHHPFYMLPRKAFLEKVVHEHLAYLAIITYHQARIFTIVLIHGNAFTYSKGLM